MEKKRMPRILLAAPKSGSGKTTVACALIQALCDRGYQVASFKCGPDYIDSLFHRKILGTRTGNLDTYFTEEEVTRYLFSKTAQDADISVIEGVMGYYDGLAGKSDRASSYEVAKATDTPVILVIDAGGASLSLLPLIKGFADWRKDSHIKGVILNKISPSFYPEIKQLIEQELSIKVCGFLPKNGIQFDSRHLGLVLPHEINYFKKQMKELGRLAEEYLDIEAILAIASETISCRGKLPEVFSKLTEGQRQEVNVAVAMDEAFQFYYQENLELLKEMGANILPFSPLHDKGVPTEADGVLLGGGYPELYAKELEANREMRECIRNLWDSKIPFLAECGGFLYLQKELEDKEKNLYQMAGVFPAKAYKTERLQRFGYIELEIKNAGILGKQGERIKGHEFHYWDCEENGQDMLAYKPLRTRNYACMIHNGHAAAGFPHLYYYSNPMLLHGYLLKCAEWREKRKGNNQNGGKDRNG